MHASGKVKRELNLMDVGQMVSQNTMSMALCRQSSFGMLNCSARSAGNKLERLSEKKNFSAAACEIGVDNICSMIALITGI